jgi:anti-sigma B factor antagonist
LLCETRLRHDVHRRHCIGRYTESGLVITLDVEPPKRAHTRRVGPRGLVDTNGISYPAAFAVHVTPIHDHRTRVSVEGELDLVSSGRLERTLKRELLAGNDVLLDLSRIEFIDSTGLHAIVSAVRTAKGTERKLKLSADLPAHARRLMEIVGLLPLMPIADETTDGTTDR